MIKLKRVFFLILSLFTVSFSVFGCTDSLKSGDPFSKFHGDVTAELSLDIGGALSTCKYERLHGVTTVTLLSPSELCGFIFTARDGSITLKVGSTEIDAEGQISFLPRLLSSVLSEKRESISEISTERADGKAITSVKTPNAVYRFGADGSPISARGISEGVEFSIVFISLSVAGAGEKTE